uniref:Uncharacterized protein n=1 Tax=Oryza brachyantha TaxID=4533 RepID=J3LCP6_ORYBR
MVATKTQVSSDLNKPSLQSQTMSPLCSPPLDASSTSNLVHTLVDHITNPMPILATGKEEEERARQVGVHMEGGVGGAERVEDGERLAPDLARVDAELIEERWLVVEGGAGARATGGLKINFHKSELFCFEEAKVNEHFYSNLFGCLMKVKDSYLALGSLMVLFRVTYWLRAWAILQKHDESKEAISIACQKLKILAMQVFGHFGWRFSNRIE